MFRKAFGSTLLYLAAVSFSYLLLWHLAFGSLRWIAAPSSLDQLNIAMKSSRMSLTWSASDDPNASGQVRSTNFLYWAPRWQYEDPSWKDSTRLKWCFPVASKKIVLCSFLGSEIETEHNQKHSGKVRKRKWTQSNTKNKWSCFWQALFCPLHDQAFWPLLLLTHTPSQAP